MPEVNSNINLRTEEVQEILTFVPRWMIRWGNGLLFFIILSLFVISYFVQYPDVISSHVVVTTVTPPEKVIARVTGNIEALLVNDNDIISPNTPIAIVENSAIYKDVLFLKEVMSTMVIDKVNFYFPIEQFPILILGEVSDEYSNFESNYYEYTSNLDLNPFLNKVDINKISIKENTNRLELLLAQKVLFEEELKLKQNDFNRSKLLYDQQVLSIQDFEKCQLGFLQVKKEYQNLNASISQLRESTNISRRNLSETELIKIQNESRLLKNTLQSYFQLKKSISDWEYRYVLKSSMRGKVSFSSIWNENQSIMAGETIFTIIPLDNSGFIGKLKAPSKNSGKLKVGQKVNIRLENYPDFEFGMLEGRVSKISLVPDNDGYYIVDVDLPESLHTTYNIEVDFKQDMRGVAEIITEDLRLIERFFYQLRHIVNK